MAIKTFPSFLDWFDRNPGIKWGTVATGVGALLMMATQGMLNTHTDERG
jgi:hypothetical protein